MPTNLEELKAIDEAIYRKLSGKEDLNNALDWKKTDVKEALGNHYYLAPRNLKRGQVLYGVLCIVIALAIAAVRVGNDLGSVVFIGLIGMMCSIPYWFFAVLMHKLQKLQDLKFLAYLSWYYSIIMAFILVIIALSIQLYGVVFIPLILLVLYYQELKKLAKLQERLNYA